MKAVWKHIFCLLWLLFFLQGVLELNVYGLENTFFDDYDTYIAATDTSAPSPIHFCVDTDFFFNSPEISSCFADNNYIIKNIRFNRYLNGLVSLKPPPLNILNAVWII